MIPSFLMLAALALGNAAAAPPAIVFGIRIYIEGEPECADRTGLQTLRLLVSSFDDPIPLDTMVGEFARVARERGAAFVYAMKIISYAPHEGVTASATAGTCAGPPADDRGLSLIDEAVSAAHVRIAPSLDLARPMMLPSSGDRLAELTPLKLKILKAVLRTAFDAPDAVAPACPFTPDQATLFRGAREAWLLASTRCRTVMIAFGNQPLRSFRVIALASDQADLLRLLLGDDER